MTFSCRFCASPLTTTVADLGLSPISNDYVPMDSAASSEPYFPLHALVCGECFLVQLGDSENADRLFRDDYAYFSSFSESWLAHARAYAEKTVAAERLGPGSTVVEIASNDGYLLQYFKAAGVAVLGVEPTANTAAVALEAHGVESEVAFFGRETAERLRARGVQADVMAANNVLAHVPDINDFVSGYPILLKPGGVANIEFPHLLQMIQQGQFDTIYHEHYSYLSLTTVRRIFAAHGMRVYDVEVLPTHGGSLRIYVAHDGDLNRRDTVRVTEMLTREVDAGLTDLDTYRDFSKRPIETKCDLLSFLIQAHRDGKSVVGYGAPAKGNTLLNYCGVKPDLIQFTVDRSPHKQGRMLPGARLEIRDPSAIFEAKPDYLLILPWNLREEIMGEMAGVREWGCRFVTPIPTVRIYD
ncbi:methyltransferase domain-containing protein [Brevundimonas sp. TWP2-3-4b1]|uniref:methyltransferase domain-containing protein n=1 Tax=Brevundimonas sp. TWP2-3-4b1 TaxID=2804580 RepID=UPI003CF5F445